MNVKREKFLPVDVQYQRILERIRNFGVMQGNRTDKDAQFIPSATIECDLRDGFPALTTKKLYFKGAIGEICCFLRGETSAETFRRMGCKFWDSDANENKTWLDSPFRKGTDDIGLAYGRTWRKRKINMVAGSPEEAAFFEENGYQRKGEIKGSDEVLYTRDDDQILEAVNKLINKPEDRRNIFHAWFPELFPMMALPPCHLMYEFVSDAKNKVLHLTMTQRSCDTLLGVPMNIFGSALILKIFAEATGYTAGKLTHNMTNVHLYDNQFEQAEVQMSREPKLLCDVDVKISDALVEARKKGEIKVDEVMDFINTLSPDDIEVKNYTSHPALEKVEMAQER